jgi:hypothetical protein
MFEFKSCQNGVGGPYQCALLEGHEGEHKNRFQLEEERRRNLDPTLDDIRRVIREEIEAALKKTRS